MRRFLQLSANAIVPKARILESINTTQGRRIPIGQATVFTSAPLNKYSNRDKDHSNKEMKRRASFGQKVTNEIRDFADKVLLGQKRQRAGEGQKRSRAKPLSSPSSGHNNDNTTRQPKAIRRDAEFVSNQQSYRTRSANKSGESAKEADRQSAHKSSGSSSVRHEKQSRRFVMDLGDGNVARIDYRPLGNNHLELYHTEVPAGLRNRGIGKALAHGALECASRDNLKLKVTCEYLADYVKRFAEDKYKRLIDNN